LFDVAEEARTPKIEGPGNGDREVVLHKKNGSSKRIKASEAAAEIISDARKSFGLAATCNSKLIPARIKRPRGTSKPAKAK
jgi:hypothetical protein